MVELIRNWERIEFGLWDQWEWRTGGNTYQATDTALSTNDTVVTGDDN